MARGYVNRPDLTTERFIRDPFATGDAARVYRTGDLVRHRADGVLEFLGRIDHQVKLRGFRIELGEIEATLSKIDGIEQAVVIVREDTPGDQRLVAYLRSGIELEANDIRDQLYASLPQYMVPAAFMFLDEMPLTPNGKVDRKQLPAPEWTAENDYIAPRTSIEQQLSDIWQSVLHIEKIGVQDNFFVLGGHSLLATQLVARIRRELELELPLMYIFDYPSVESLAVSIEAFMLATDMSFHDNDDEDMEDIGI